MPRLIKLYFTAHLAVVWGLRFTALNPMGEAGERGEGHAEPHEQLHWKRPSRKPTENL